jgi:deazaflavin-dependent oxidoreductase (nitroreductase family)
VIPSLTRIGNRMAVWLYRRSDGRLVGGGKVLMLTVPGRRTGLRRSTCMRFLETDGGLVVWGTASGAPRDPDWFRNLRAADAAEVQVGRDTIRVRPRELLGAEREAMWQGTVLARVPEVVRYARRAGRPIPVAVLEPV